VWRVWGASLLIPNTPVSDISLLPLKRLLLLLLLLLLLWPHLVRNDARRWHTRLPSCG